MKALILDTKDPQIVPVIRKIKDLGHEVCQVVGWKQSSFIRELSGSSVVLAMGTLTPFGIWGWGYANARNKKVIACKGVVPAIATKQSTLEDWLDSIPEQGRLF